MFVGLSFTINPSDIIQIEGLNGTGKTSLLRILAGLVRPDVGEVCWQNKNILSQPERYHQNLIFIGHQPGIKTVLTPYENLKFYQSLKQQKDNQAIWRALEQVGLIGYENLPVAQLSTGQQRRVALARLWLSHCPLWILDEPLTAIDKKGVTELITLFKLLLSCWTLAVALCSRQMPLDCVASVLSIMGIITAGFLPFIIMTSNPFARTLPDFPVDGRDLNPLLQDIGLIFHPPLLYMGYVGFSVAFAIASLISGQLPLYKKYGGDS
ncbi:cytochrome c biogenesis heme-transporting ATPase CcmA [Photorhabdus viridis]|uniref:cytochrome c biogenesis heme-transporting ATPase CcmA n=1 Tax=Photorhabdus viridis TaxID=3163327 RepID=UPI0033078893